MSEETTLQSKIEALESEIRRLTKVNVVLMARVERSLESQGDAFSLFESNILLQGTVEKRTGELKAEILERERAEQALRKSRQKLLLHIQRTPLGVIEWDRDYRIVEWNNAAKEMFGFTKEEALGKHPAGFIVLEEMHQRIDQIWTDLIDKRGGERSTNVNMRKDGKLITCEWYNTPLIDDNGDVMGVASLVQDVTERVQNDKEKKDRLERVQKQRFAIGRLSTDEVITTGSFDQAARIMLEIVSEALDVNQVSLWLFSNDFSKMTCANLYMTSDDKHSSGLVLNRSDYPDYFQAVGKDRVVVCDNAQTDPRTCEFTDSYLAPLGITSMLDVAFRVSGNLIGVVCNEHLGPPRKWQSDEIAFADEISGILSQIYLSAEQKRYEAQQKELQERLERAERMESLGILAGGVAHDLNNTLGPVVGYTDLILMRLNEDDKTAKQVQKIGKSAQDAADVIQDLLTLARRGRYDMTPTDLNSVILEYLESPCYLRLKDNRQDVTVDVKLDNSGKMLMGSTTHLSKVVMNLIVNACDAMADGGTLTILTASRHIDVLTNGYELGNDRGQYIMLSVADTGKGIPSEDLDKIFEPYYSKKKMGGSSGSGLGLSVVYGVVKDHKGYYDIISEPGQGAEFRLYFPITTDLIDLSSNINDEVGGTESILVVDDNEGQRDVAAELLKIVGYEVYTASSGEEAIEFLKGKSVDLVVLDMIMDPGIDGLDTFRKIIEIHPGQKAVIASGYSATERVEEMQRLGAGQYIKKPFTIQKIRRAIREELSKEAVKQ